VQTKIIREGDKVWLDGVEGWSPKEKVSSVHAVFEAILKALGEDISYDYLVGISSLAFRMQVGGLCPSSPHPCCGYKCVDRAIKALPWKIKGYGFNQNNPEGLDEIYEIVVHSIDRGIPVSTSEEEDGVIIGYQKENKALICLHPWHNNGKKPFNVSSIPEICWGIGVYTERKSEQEDQKKLIFESLKQAVEMAKTKRTDNYFVGFKAWEQYIKILQSLNKSWNKFNKNDMLGNAWIYESLVQYRDVAARYLFSIKDKFGESAKQHLEKAVVWYQQMSRDILKGEKAPKEIAPYPESLKKGEKWTKEMRGEQIKRLDDARQLEIQAIDEIEKALSSITV